LCSRGNPGGVMKFREDPCEIWEFTFMKKMLVMIIHSCVRDAIKWSAPVLLSLLVLLVDFSI
jgi:hypothetical protein